MRHILKITLLLATLLLAVPVAGREAKERRHKPSKTEMAQKQASRIADELGLEDETRDRFVATFVNCQKDIWGLHPGRPKNKRGPSMTDEQADSLIRARFDHSQRMLDTRRKYYEEYLKFLTPRQIDRVYDLERDMMKRLNGNKCNSAKPGKSDARKKARRSNPDKPQNPGMLKVLTGALPECRGKLLTSRP